MRSEKEIRRVLDSLKKFGKEGHIIEEMQGEILALEYVLEERNDLL